MTASTHPHDLRAGRLFLIGRLIQRPEAPAGTQTVVQLQRRIDVTGALFSVVNRARRGFALNEALQSTKYTEAQFVSAVQEALDLGLIWHTEDLDALDRLHLNGEFTLDDGPDDDHCRVRHPDGRSVVCHAATASALFAYTDLPTTSVRDAGRSLMLDYPDLIDDTSPAETLADYNVKAAATLAAILASSSAPILDRVYRADDPLAPNPATPVRRWDWRNLFAAPPLAAVPLFLSYWWYQDAAWIGPVIVAAYLAPTAAAVVAYASVIPDTKPERMLQRLGRRQHLGAAALGTMVGTMALLVLDGWALTTSAALLTVASALRLLFMCTPTARHQAKAAIHDAKPNHHLRALMNIWQFWDFDKRGVEEAFRHWMTTGLTYDEYIRTHPIYKPAPDGSL